MKIKGGLGLWSVVLAAGLAFFGDVQGNIADGNIADGNIAGSVIAGRSGVAASSDVVGRSGVAVDGDVAGSVIAGGGAAGRSGGAAGSDVAGSVIAGRSGVAADGGVAVDGDVQGGAINNSRIRVKFTFGGAAWAAADGTTVKSNTAKSSAADGNEQAAEMAAEAAEPETFDYKTVSSKLAEIEAEIRQDNFTRQTLDDASAFLAQQDTKLDQFIHDIEKNSKYAEESLAALGEAPAEGMSEDPAMAEMRSKYTALVNNYKSRMSEANLLKVEISRISSIIAEARSRIIIGNLVAEQNVIISPQNFVTAISDAAVFFWQIAMSPIEWYKGLSDEERDSVAHSWWYVLLVLTVVLSIGLFIRQYIIRHWGYGHTEDSPRYGQKIVVAVITAIAYGVIPSLLIGGCLLWQLTNVSLTHSKFGVVLANVLYYSLYITLIRALARVTLAPWNGRWRLFNISDERAERVFAATTLSIILLGAAACIRRIAGYFEASDALVLLLEVAGDAIKAFVIILMTSRILGQIKRKSADEETPEPEPEDGRLIDGAVDEGALDNPGLAAGEKSSGEKATGQTEIVIIEKGEKSSGEKAEDDDSAKGKKEAAGAKKESAAVASSQAAAAEKSAPADKNAAGIAIGGAEDEETEKMPLSSKIIISTTLFALITFGVSLFGYPELATFIFNRFIASVLFVGAFVIVRRFISDLIRRSIVFWIKTFKMRKRLLSKADLLMTLFVTPLLLLFLAYSLLVLWGIPGAFMVQAAKKLMFGFKVGGINISLISIITGLAVFVISLMLMRMMKKRLANNLLNRINMDEGIRHSLISGFSFTGIIISAILAIVAMGIDLSNLAVIAGALSVGIGFGLQDVIKNLVSGIILLFERPFKVGDWVLIGGEEGKIKQINIRSTEVETFNKASVIIPNATLISSSLTNLTHGNNWQRQSVMVGVSYDSDADQVTRLLLECARSCKKVMRVPAPYVLFKNFGESSLDFELRFYVSDIWSGWQASSDIRYEILRRFRDENINIAYPQIVVHQGSEDTSVKGWQTNV